MLYSAPADADEIDLQPDADADRVAADIAFAVDRFLAPPVLNYTLDEMRARHRADGSLWSIPEIFEGPKLVNGFIDDEELAAAGLRSEVRLSDVISVIMDIPGVVAIRDILLNTLDSTGKAIEPVDKWRLGAALWPDERLGAESRDARLHSAISTLRKEVGLQDAIVAPLSDPKADATIAVAAATGQYTAGILRAGMRIGVGWCARCMSRCVS